MEKTKTINKVFEAFASLQCVSQRVLTIVLFNKMGANIQEGSWSFSNLLIKAVFVWLLSNLYDKGGGLQESRFNLESSIKIEEVEMLKSLDRAHRAESRIIGWGTSKSEVWLSKTTSQISQFSTESQSSWWWVYTWKADTFISSNVVNTMKLQILFTCNIVQI